MILTQRKLTALLLAVILMFSFVSLAEEEIVIDTDSSDVELSSIDEAALIDDSSLELDGSIDLLEDLDLMDPSITLPTDSEDGSSSQPKPTQDTASEELTSEIEEAVEGSESTEASNTITLGVKETYKLNTSKLGKNLTFKSSKPKIASVSKKGVITGLKKGTSKITVMSGKKKKAEYTVKVVAAPAKITLSVNSLTLGVKESKTVKATLTKGSHAFLTWSSANKTIATVDKNGKITGKKAGKTTITVKTHNGKKATLKVTVVKEPSKVTLNKTSATLMVGKTLNLKASVPSGSQLGKLTWKSNKAGVASVNANGKVTAIGYGTAKITVKTYNGKTATCTVKVKALASNKSSVTVDADDSETVRITAYGEGNLRWQTGNEDVAVCQWGDGWDGDKTDLYIHGVDEGSTTITITDTDTGETLKIKVKVVGHPAPGYTGEIFGSWNMDVTEFNQILDDPLLYYGTDDDGTHDIYLNGYMIVYASSSTNLITTLKLSGNTSGKYTLCDIHPGMSFSSAQDAALNYGWTYFFTKNDSVYYQASLNGQNIYLVLEKNSDSYSLKSVTLL